MSGAFLYIQVVKRVLKWLSGVSFNHVASAVDFSINVYGIQCTCSHSVPKSDYDAAKEIAFPQTSSENAPNLAVARKSVLVGLYPEKHQRFNTFRIITVVWEEILIWMIAVRCCWWIQFVFGYGFHTHHQIYCRLGHLRRQVMASVARPFLLPELCLKTYTESATTNRGKCSGTSWPLGRSE